MKLIRRGVTEIDGRKIYQNIIVEVEVPNEDGRHETCAICKNPEYPECTKRRCGILGNF